MSKVLVIFHGPYCPDGFGAKWLLKKAYPDAEYVPGIYQAAPPEVKDRHVIFADFCFKREVMAKIAAEATTLTVLDHHDSAMKDMKGFSAPNAQVFFDMKRSGVRIVWDFILANNLLPAEVVSRMTAYRPDFIKESTIPATVPWLVAYIEDRDLWNFKHPFSNEVTLATRARPLTEESWDAMNEGRSGDLLADGKAIKSAQDEMIKAHVKGAVPFTLGGVEGLAVNASTLFSEIAGELAKTAKFGATWRAGKFGIEWSLRADKNGPTDVSAIALKYGGGGHVAAAGFRSGWKLLEELGLLPELVSDKKT